MSLVTCPAYSLTYPAVAACGPFTACPGQVITASTCETCVGDTDLKLFDANGVQVWEGDDGCSNQNYCSFFSYDVPPGGACQEYTLSQGCYAGYTCSATTQVTVNSPVPTASPSAAPNAYVQYFHNADCSGGTAGTAVVDSGACTPYAAYPSFVFEVRCPSNNPNATWIANAYTNGGCWGSPYQTNTGNGGACDECIYVENTGWSYKVNCGSELAPGCTAPPSIAPTPGPPTAEPTAHSPTLAPSKGVEAYVQYYDDWVCTDPSTYQGSAVVDSGACTVYGDNTYALDVQCDTNTPDSAWTATGYFYGDLTCSGTASYMTYTGTGACSCTWLMMTFQSVMINCGGQPVDCTAPPTAIPTFEPTAVATIAPSKGVEVYLQYFYANDCFSTLVSSAVIDSGACTPAVYNSYYTFSVACESNSVDSDWTAQVFTGWNSGCSGTPYTTLSGSGNCECQQVGGYKFSVNCGSAPMTCAAPPSMAPTTAAPILPTAAPSKGVEAYVKYFYDSTCFGEPVQQFVVDSGGCNNNYPWDSLQVSCQSNDPTAAWSANVYMNDFDTTCNLAPVQTLEGSGPCGECTYLYSIGYYAEISCGGFDSCPSDPYAEPTIAPTDALEPGAYVTVYDDKTCSSGYTEGDRVPLKKCVRLGYSGMYGNFTCDSLSAASNWTSQVFSDSSCATQIGTVQGGDACDCFAFNGASSRSYSITMNCNGAEERPCPTPEPTEYPTQGPTAVLQLYGTQSCTMDYGITTAGVPLGECFPLNNGNYAVFSCDSASTLSPWHAQLYNDSTCSTASIQTFNADDACDCMTYDVANAWGSSARLNCAGWQTPEWQCPDVGGGYVQVYDADTCTGSNGGGNAPLNSCLSLGYSGYYGNFTCESLTTSSNWTTTVHYDPSCSSETEVMVLQGSDACECGLLGRYGITMNCAGGAPAQCYPTVMPSAVPSVAPTAVPTFVPSTTAPVVTPTVGPTVSPSNAPNAPPTFVPSATTAPVVTPTVVPSASAAPVASPTAVPSVGPTAAATNATFAFVQYFEYNQCFTGAVGTSVVSNGVCTPVPSNGFMKYSVVCASNDVNSPWTARVYSFDNTCAGTPIEVITGAGNCQCNEFTTGNNFAVNCGMTPMVCAAPPSMSPTTSAPVVPTRAPTGGVPGVEAYVKYFSTYDEPCQAAPTYTYTVDSGTCNSVWGATATLQVNCQSNSANSAWTANVYTADLSETCMTNVVQTFSGSGPCGACVYVPEMFQYVEVNCGGTDACAVTPPPAPSAAPSAMLTVYDSNTCSSAADSVYGLVPLNTCVAMSTTGLYTTLTCESLSSKSAWNASIYQNTNCAGDAAYVVHGDNANECITAGGLYSLTLDCGAGVKSSSSSEKMSSGEVGGIVGGVVGGVLVLTLVGLWAFGMIGFGAASAGAAGGASGAAGGAAAASAPADVEMATTTTTVNPIAPPVA